MNRKLALNLAFLLLFGMNGLSLSAQMIWPGDVNNNGQVTGMDLLYLGTQLNYSGFDRPNASTDWNAQPMGQSWNFFLPGTTLDAAYADVNGDGFISETDIDDGLALNYFKTHGSVIPDNYPATGQDGIDAPLKLQTSLTEVALGAQVQLDLHLGSEALPAQNFYGICLKVNYDPALLENGLSFEKSSGWWIDPSGSNARFLMVDDQETGVAELTIIRVTTDNSLANGFGKVGTFNFTITNNQDLVLPLALNFEVTDVIMVNYHMQSTPVFPSGVSLNISSSGGPSTDHCPDVIAPVCGENGVTYLNSCFAEAAGIFNYTAGVCFDGCIDAELIDPAANCEDTYDPVCGCNGITYYNECVAIANGVTSFSNGPCNTDCYDAVLIVSAAGTTVDSETGVISQDCEEIDEPVCGCNGITYENACLAEASGITFYTQGTCGNDCVEPTEMDTDANCANIYDPVCGCNGVTYSNSCYADAAGVQEYSPGVCGPTSSWCQEAIPIQCGDYLAYETTVGTGNQINNYPGCSNSNYFGSEKVYILNKTSAGDLQVGIEINSEDIDLDLFLLADNCGQIVCLAASTNDNELTNSESILLENAAPGTYYIVVDGQSSSEQGSYQIEVECGYLNCSDAELLTCGEPFLGNNAEGDDNIAHYTCDDGLNTGNNGPEMLHYFTIVEAAEVTIELTDLTANLDIFLLESCDRSDCIDYSKNPGESAEIITVWLEAGTYYVSVDGYKGATGDYSLTVDCDVASCQLEILNLTTTAASCGNQDGSINIVSGGGTGGFIVDYSGPVSGSFYALDELIVLTDLPAGIYTITLTDVMGCVVEEVAEISSLGAMEVSLEITDLMCGMAGAVAGEITGGVAPYEILLIGQEVVNLTSATHDFNIDHVTVGEHMIYITDANGCVVFQSIELNDDPGNFYFEATAYSEVCGEPGYIEVQTFNGIPIYSVFVSGPVSWYEETDNPSIILENLPAGIYTITIEDGNWCTYNQVVVVEEVFLEATAIPLNAICGDFGGIQVDINYGTAPYNISWVGPTSGNGVSLESTYIINDVPSGVYQINVVDANGCTDQVTVEVENAGGQLDFTLSPVNGDCLELGSITVNIPDGSGPFEINWTGPVSGSVNTESNTYVIEGLPSGVYTVLVTDATGCYGSQMTTIINDEGDVTIHTTLILNDCGQYNWVWVDIEGGWPTYTITWTGPESGDMTTDGNGFEIIDLPPGDYIIIVTDIHGCTATAEVTIYEAPVELLTLTGINGECGELGTVVANVIDGDPDYQISWDGPVSGSVTTSSTTHTISDLPSGTYTFTLLDGNWCTDVEEVTIVNTPGGLDFSTTLSANVCGQDDQIEIDITGGWASFVVAWSGPENGIVNISESEFTIGDLPPGTYTISVTDNYGCTVYKVVTIEETPSDLLLLTGINGDCGDDGTIIAKIEGGVPSFVYSWTGPVSGSATSNSAIYTINDLPSGTYTVSITDSNLCTDTETITINNTESDLDISTTLVVNDCGQYNWIWIDIIGGEPTYTITWTGPESGSETTDGNGFEIIDLPPGDYTVTITDTNGCVVSVVVTIYEAPIELLSLTANDGDCNEFGSITASVIDGIPVYEISWTGPVSGSVSTSEATYEIENLPSGTYTVTLLDGNWCTDVEVITVNNVGGDITLVAAPVNGDCAQNGGIWLDVFNGTGPYSITWVGPVSGTVTTEATGYGINNLPEGVYTITVIDANGCTDTAEVTVIVSEDDLEITAVSTDADCDQGGSVQVTITGGDANYLVSWEGPISGSIIVPGPEYVVLDLPAGTYQITVTDINGCVDATEVTIGFNNTGLSVTSMTFDGYCNGLGNIWMDFYNGIPPFTITWEGLVSGDYVTNEYFYDIINLPTGTYTYTVTDVNGCAFTETVSIVNIIDDLTATLTPVQGGCGQPGSIEVNILGGTPGYTVTWFSNNASGNAVSEENNYSIENLPSGIYTVSIEDVNGCGETLSVQLLNHPDNLPVSFTSTHPTCDQLGAIEIEINGGTPNFVVSWEGPSTGGELISDDDYTISGLIGGEYTITINDAAGCFVIENITLDNTTESPVVDFDYQVSGLSVEFENLSAVGSYLWTFGDGNFSSATSPVHEYGSSGSYQVCLTVTNDCGAATHCESIEVVNGSDAVILDIGEISGEAGTTVSVPVVVNNCDLLVFLEGTIKVNDTEVATVVGVSGGIITPQFSAATNTFNYYDNTEEGIVVADGDILFYFDVELIGEAGSETGLQLINNPIEVAVSGVVNDLVTELPHITVPGGVEIMEGGTVQGYVTTFWGEGIEAVEVNINGPGMEESKMTDENGGYTMAGLSYGQTYTLEAEKDVVPENGVSSYGLFIGQQFILGMEPPQLESPYQVIAGDANCNGAFTTIDLYLAQLLITGSADEFSNCASWVFVSQNNDMPTEFDTENVFPYNSATSVMVMNDTVVNFVGVKVGDILGEASSDGLTGDDSEIRNDNQLILKTDNHEVAAGAYINLPVTSNNFDEIVAFQLGLTIDESKLSFVEFLPGEHSDLTSLAGAFTEGQIRMSWFNNQGVESTFSPEEELFTIRLLALEDIDDISNLIAVSNQVILSEAHKISGEPLDVVLEFNGVTSTVDAAIQSFELFQNEPNPFAEETRIRFYLPSAMEAELVIYDNLGRKVHQSNGQFAKGENKVIVSGKELDEGVYFYSLKAGAFAETRSMIILK